MRLICANCTAVCCGCSEHCLIEIFLCWIFAEYADIGKALAGTGARPSRAASFHLEGHDAAALRRRSLRERRAPHAAAWQNTT
jgi:hypothetical protein